jgi:diacylglycerol kinase (ATP)
MPNRPQNPKVEQGSVVSKPTVIGPVARILRAAGYSREGLKAAWRDEASLRQEVVMALVMAPIALFIARNPIELALLFLPLFAVVVVELLNSAVEAVVDLVSPDHHPLAKKAKDIGSAAVFLSIVATITAWVLVIAQRWF